MMTVTMVATASALLFTGVLLAACRADSDESAENPVPANWGDTLEVGVLYDYNLRIHCGMQWLGMFNGQYWFADDAPPYSTGGSPPPLLDWERVDGLMNLVDEDLIEYRIVGTDVVIEYQPTPEEQPACY